MATPMPPMRTASQMQVKLDYIPDNLVSDPESLHRELSQRLGVRVVSVRVRTRSYTSLVL